MRRLIASASVVGLVVAGLLAVGPTAASAMAPPPSLAGEVLGAGCGNLNHFVYGCFGGTVTVTSCTAVAGGGGEFSFSAQGPATGPYPGTFSESGTVTLGPPGMGGGAQVTGFTSTFSIASAAGTVNGSKSAAGVTQPMSFNTCPATTGFPVGTFAGSFVTYTATIQTSQGNFSDSGNSQATVADQDPQANPTEFFEGFNQSNGVALIAGCPNGQNLNVRWHYSAGGSSGSWSGTGSCANGAVTLGPQAMEGDLKVAPGMTISVGYDLTMPGNKTTHTVTFTNSQVVFSNVHCASGAPPSSTSFTVAMPDRSYSVTNTAWYPSGDQASPLVYQGSTPAPDLCGGGLLRLDKGGTFTSTISAS